MPKAMVHISVVVELDGFPVPEDGYNHVLAEAIGVQAAIIADDNPAGAIDRIELLEDDEEECVA